MTIVVQKYGGSSLADVAKIQAVAKRIAEEHEQGRKLVVVVSAMGNTTSELIHLARQVTLEPDRRELDMLISVGERISMALLAMALKDLGIPACSLTGSQSGIITDTAHANARVVEVRPDRVQRAIEEGKVVIIAGFQGVSRNREVTTLGRGGSDTTAVVLAAALGAAYCEICSDVDGVWSADPRVVTDALKQDSMSLDEALALARGGAKVLFEDAVKYARDHGVEIRASKTFGPGSGTRLQTSVLEKRKPISVTGDGKLVRLSRKDFYTSEQIQSALDRGLRVRRCTGDFLYADIRNAHGDLSDSKRFAPIGMVSAVGSGLGEDVVRISTIDAAIREAGKTVAEQGAAGDVAWWQVERHEVDDVVRIVHRALNSEHLE